MATRGQARARYEAQLSSCKRRLEDAAYLADSVGDDTAALDLNQMAFHIVKLLEESLKGGRSKPGEWRRSQLPLRGHS